MSSIIELATGSTGTGQFGSGVNKALNVEAKSVFEVKESIAGFRKLAARYEKTSKAVLDLEKYNKLTVTNGGDLEDGVANATWTVIDDQALVTFDTGFAISVGFKLTPKLLRQAREDPASFMARYRRKIAFDMQKKEDIYLGSVMIAGTNKVYGGAATDTASLGTGSIFTVELFETMIDDMQEREYEPTDFISQAKVIGQLRRDARLLNDSDFSVAIKEDGRTATQVGDVTIHSIKGVDIIPNFAVGSGSGTYGIMIDREGAFGLVDFLKKEGGNPITISVGQPDPTLDGANFHRILGQSELQAKVLDQSAIIVAEVSKA